MSNEVACSSKSMWVEVAEKWSSRHCSTFLRIKNNHGYIENPVLLSRYDEGVQIIIPSSGDTVFLPYDAIEQIRFSRK